MTHKDNIDECQHIFISWGWGIGFITGFIIVACGVVYAYEREQSDQNWKIQSIQNDLTDIKTAYLKHNQDMDTLKNILRSNHQLLLK